MEIERRKNAGDISAIKQDITEIRTTVRILEREVSETLSEHEKRIRVNEVKLEDEKDNIALLRSELAEQHDDLKHHFRQEAVDRKKIFWAVIGFAAAIAAVLWEQFILPRLIS